MSLMEKIACVVLVLLGLLLGCELLPLIHHGWTWLA